MRRSSFTVHFEDGRVESLSRDEIRNQLVSGKLSNRDAISIANGRPKQPGAFPAFADVAPPVTNDYPVVGGTSKSATTTGSRQVAKSSGESSQTRARSESRPVQRASLKPPSITDSGAQGRIVRDVRTETSASSGASVRSFTAEVPTAALDWGQPLPLELFSGPAEELRETLWRSPPPAIVGCDAHSGRHVAIRSASERQALIRARLEQKPSAGDRILLEDCKAMIDLALRVVTQPAKWREWQQRSREDGAAVSIGVFGKVKTRIRNRPTGPERAAATSLSGGDTEDLNHRMRRLRRLHPEMSDEGLQMLVASGADLFEDSASVKKVPQKKKNNAYTKRKKSTAPDPMKAAKKPGFLDLPPWLSNLLGKKRG